jgi:hypothetical protein
VAVAIVSDAQFAATLPVSHAGVQTAYDAEGELLWAQARWTGPSPSPS